MLVFSQAFSCTFETSGKRGSKMDSLFISSLSREAEGKDFRVIVPPDGYREAIDDLMQVLSGPQGRLSAELAIDVQRDYSRAQLRLIINRATVTPDGNSVRFDGAVAEFLDEDGRGTGNFVEVLLGINIESSRPGDTAGVLRMQSVASIA
jgi:hypothetical protein